MKWLGTLGLGILLGLGIARTEAAMQIDDGLTHRDKLALAAMVGLIASGAAERMPRQDLASKTYSLADEMLRQREYPRR